ncbi:NADH-quinone oxidoreductase subunit N [Chitiniphilus shinanonensis]|uniref:NADH-quinone oxidoreductase subunit N n=1 Tax=Chitiniphilus shinanonensis TaxID=553088 RepID=A0ABQ6BPT9_9NEIS|nr:NADH-quinone oxidoreductase subunit NuoN [Chitiniphilus shinanonensis]GLS03462.1 NADH-quinone oxidoreductase subunit N [Chitiniphilus shinanonensis]
MTWTSLNAWVAAPEIFLFCATCAILLLDLFVSDAKRGFTHWLSLAVLVVTGALLVRGYHAAPQYAFSHMFVADPLATLAKVGMVVGVALVLIYGRSYAADRGIFKGELYSLALFSLLGMMVMASAINLLTLYVGLELLSLSLYALVALRRDSVESTEAAMKYFVLGALASGMLLYGMSMLYGATASLNVLEISQRLMVEQSGNPLLATFGLVFVVTGIAFKLGAVPFHMWVPDVYQGAPTPITQLIGSAPKLAAFAFTIRLLAQAMEGFTPEWRSMLVVLAVLSLAIGNLTAIAQTNIKRMFAYSTISHMGFLLLGILVGNVVGYSAAFFYAVTYMLTAAAGFGVVMLLARQGFEADRLDDYKGLARTHPWFAGMLLLVMFSMAGVPVFVGFFAKLAVLKAVVDLGMVWLAVFAVAMSLIGAFYYLRVVKLMYFDEPEGAAAPLSGCMFTRVVLSLNCLALLGIGLFPNDLLLLLTNAVEFSLPI